jgi:hypothetical protein
VKNILIEKYFMGRALKILIKVAVKNKIVQLKIENYTEFRGK